MVSLGLIGCDSPPGAALVVAGANYSEDSLQQRSSQVDQAQTTQPVNQLLVTDSQNRRQATLIIRHSLIQQAAAQKGITVTDQQVNDFLVRTGPAQVAAGLQVPQADVGSATRDLLVLSTMVQQIPAAGTPVADVEVTYDLVLATNRSDAVAKRARYLSDPGTMAADAEATGGQVNQKASVVTSNNIGSLGVFQAPVGSVTIIPRQNDYVVFRVSGRQPKRTPLTQQIVSAESSSPMAQLDLAALLLGPQAATTSITVNPRYGVWDPVSLSVVPTNDGM